MSLPATTKRPKGYVTWNPRSNTRAVLANVLEILETYRNNLPLTARQIFYRLVGAYDYPKDELAYNRLCEYLVRARRSGMIPFNNIRDDGTIVMGAYGYLDPKTWWESTAQSARNYHTDRTWEQPASIEVWCEAGGMTPQLARIAQPYGVSVYSTGGFSSVTVTHEIAQRVVRDYRPTVFLHIGDFDPSGQSIYESMSEDVDTFVSQLHTYQELWPDTYPYVDQDSGFIYRRVALTESQVEEYDLPTAPPKKTDSRTANWIGETCQAEAMAPDELAALLDRAITGEMDMDKYREVLAQEERDRKELSDEVDRILQDKYPPDEDDTDMYTDR